MNAQERARILLDADDEADLPLEFLRLVLRRSPDEFNALVARLESVEMPAERKAELRRRLVVLAGE